MMPISVAHSFLPHCFWMFLVHMDNGQGGSERENDNEHSMKAVCSSPMETANRHFDTVVLGFDLRRNAILAQAHAA